MDLDFKYYALAYEKNKENKDQEQKKEEKPETKIKEAKADKLNKKKCRIL